MIRKLLAATIRLIRRKSRCVLSTLTRIKRVERMARVKYWLGSVGPYVLDDAQTYPDGVLIKALRVLFEGSTADRKVVTLVLDDGSSLKYELQIGPNSIFIQKQDYATGTTERSMFLTTQEIAVGETGHAFFRAARTDADGLRVIMEGLPTSAPADSNRVWNDGGTLKIT